MSDVFINLPDLIGRLESDSLVQRFIRHYKLVDYEETEPGKQMYSEHGTDITEEIWAQATEMRRNFSITYVLDPINWVIALEARLNQPGTEKSVSNITVRRDYPGRLPFGLMPDADLSGFMVGRLIKKSKRTQNGITSHLMEFFDNHLSITIGFDEPHNHFSFLRIDAIDPDDLIRLRFHDGLDAQKANLVDDVSACFEQWQKANPVRLWRQRMLEGDSIFNETNLRLTDEEINVFFANIQQAVKKRSPKQIVNALKKTINNINRLNRKHGYFIETKEREELAPFLQNVLHATGLQFEKDFDVTLEWRDW
ncbi:MAG: hypothetical protein FWC42_01435 [Proteobacteria bacterium]|nr:hypothetical protein [Pseudomonadota bacterium]